MMGVRKRAFSGVFIEENAHRSRSPCLHLQGEWSSAAGITFHDLFGTSARLRLLESGAARQHGLGGNLSWDRGCLPGLRQADCGRGPHPVDKT